jgi:hypothetical protein
MKRFQLWCAAALLPFLAACSFSLFPKTDFTETRIFDLASPEPLSSLPFLVDVESFSTECSGRYKMVFREDTTRISVDEYNRWAMPPGAMLTRYLAVRFAAQADKQEHVEKPAFVLDGSVLNWELDKSKKQVDMVVRFVIFDPNNDLFRITGSEDYSIPIKDTTAEAFADGMNKAASKFADHVTALLNGELKNRTARAKDAATGK